MRIKIAIWGLMIVCGVLSIDAQGVITGPKKTTRTNSVSKKSKNKNSFGNANQLESAIIVECEEIAIPDTLVTHGFVNGHEWVDLGLPSGVRWATCNVGATLPESDGNYYAWGETNLKDSYIMDNSLSYNKEWYWLKLAGIIDDFGDLTKKYDSASICWGKSWRIPSKKEFEELKENCTWSWTTFFGQPGYKVSGKNGQFIFLPASGYWIGNSKFYAKLDGAYWSSSSIDNDTKAYGLIFGSGDINIDNFCRSYGCSIRPITN